jgi:hypothetical protein
MAFITVEQLASVFAVEFPQLVRCKDYWVAHPVDSENNSIQTDHAWIVEWNVEHPKQPTDADIQTLWKKHGPGVLSAEADVKARADRKDLLTEADVLVNIAEDNGDLDFSTRLRTYRQALRDITKQQGYPLNIKWPEMPK